MQPKLADLPLGWCWTILGTIAEITHGIIKGRNRLRPPPMRPVHYLRYANVRRNSLDLEEVKTILADDEKIEACRLQKGDLLFTELGERDNLGRCCVWNDEIEECIHQNHVFRARVCLHLLDPKFISLHGNLFGQRWFNSTGKQTTGLATISKADLSRLPVPLAPLNEQRRIVVKIEELFSHLDAGVSALKRVKENLERYRASVLQAAITGKLTKAWRAKHSDTASELLQRILVERRSKWDGNPDRYKPPAEHDQAELPAIPDTWVWVSLGTVAWSVKDGPHYSPPYSDCGIPFITAGNVRPDGIDFSSAKFITPELHAELSLNCKPEYGDLLYTKGGNTGIATINWEKTEFNVWVHVSVLKLVDCIERRFVHHALNSPFCYAQSQRHTVGVGNPFLALTRMVKIAIPLPPLDEQRAIAEEVDRRLAIIKKVQAQVEANLKRADHLCQGILKRAFEGRLVPQDSTDEPADKLLERIVHERNGHPRSQKPRPKGTIPMSNVSQQIVNKVWNFAQLLRDDGLSYMAYVEQLVFLLFLKMANEKNLPVPAGYGWSSLLTKEGVELQAHYRQCLENLGKQPGMLGEVFNNARAEIQNPSILRRLIVDLIEPVNWSFLQADVIGDIYEGLLQKTAVESPKGAGQHLTPRPLIQAIVDCVQPTADDTVCDPAAGMAGMLICSHAYVSRKNLTLHQKQHLRKGFVRGWELVPNAARLCIMNLYLHGIDTDPSPITSGVNCLATDPGERFSVVLTNPPFGKKSNVLIGTEASDDEFVRHDFWATSKNKQLNFLQHSKTLLKKNGRCAIVVPDNALFEGGAGETVRRHLLKQFDVHTLLRLPTGIFYAQGVQANVLFFDARRGQKELWVYDLRTNMHFTQKTRPLKRSDLDEFVACYQPGSRQDRKQMTSIDRWRAFSYAELLQRDKVNLDISWLNDESLGANALTEPDLLAQEITSDLQMALEQFALIGEKMDS